MLALAFACAAGSASAQSGPYRWWLSRDIQRELRLTPQQVNRIDEIFQSNLAERRSLRRKLDELEKQLSALVDSATADDGDAGALIQRVEAARARRNVARMTMLYRIRQVLTPEQRKRLDHRGSGR